MIGRSCRQPLNERTLKMAKKEGGMGGKRGGAKKTKKK
jgi:hypothetical protein